MSSKTAVLVIPPRYAHWMRLAGLRLLKSDTEGVVSEAAKTDENVQEEAFKARHSIGERKSLDWLFSDLNGCASFVASLVPPVEQLAEGKDSITGPPEILCALVDSMVRNVLAEELGSLDFPDGEEGELHDAIRALSWAAKEGDRLVTLEINERKAAKAATERKAA